MSVDIFLAHGRQDERTKTGKADLTAVGVSGEDEVDQRTARVLNNDVSVVGFVGHEDDWSVGFCRDGAIWIGIAGAGIIKAAEPKAFATALDGDIAIDQHRDPVLRESSRDDGGVKGYVVVTENGIDLRCGKGAENLGATEWCVFRHEEAKGSVCDEVSGKQDEVRFELIDAFNRTLEKEWLGVLVEVDVAELGDPETVEAVRKISDVDCAADYLQLVACDFTRVEDHASSGDATAKDKLTTGKARPLAACGTGHTSMITGAQAAVDQARRPSVE